ncbi:MAG: hypothetical protein IJT09_02655 [Abditibacteriota bacterium]|nr:hypothetical protein [Abditibacteriota bacterium]
MGKKKTRQTAAPTPPKSEQRFTRDAFESTEAFKNKVGILRTVMGSGETLTVNELATRIKAYRKEKING